jgi:hypothetical protein
MGVMRGAVAQKPKGSLTSMRRERRSANVSCPPTTCAVAMKRHSFTSAFGNLIPVLQDTLASHIHKNKKSSISSLTKSSDDHK